MLMPVTISASASPDAPAFLSLRLLMCASSAAARAAGAERRNGRSARDRPCGRSRSARRAGSGPLTHDAAGDLDRRLGRDELQPKVDQLARGDLVEARDDDARTADVDRDRSAPVGAARGATVTSITASTRAYSRRWMTSRSPATSSSSTSPSRNSATSASTCTRPRSVVRSMPTRVPTKSSSRVRGWTSRTAVARAASSSTSAGMLPTIGTSIEPCCARPLMPGRRPRAPRDRPGRSPRPRCRRSCRRSRSRARSPR